MAYNTYKYLYAIILYGKNNNAGMLYNELALLHQTIST